MYLKLGRHWDTGQCGRDKIEELVRSMIFFSFFERRFCHVDQASLEFIILLLSGGITGMHKRKHPRSHNLNICGQSKSLNLSLSTTGHH